MFSSLKVWWATRKEIEVASDSNRDKLDGKVGVLVFIFFSFT